MRRLRRLVHKKALRWSEGVCVLEGPDLIDAALDASVEFEALYLDAAAVSQARVHDLAERARRAGVRVYALQPGVVERVADAVTPQPVLASVRLPLSELSAITLRGLVLVAHDVRDPGNAGTIVRSAHAAEVDAVIFTGQSVDPFNPKALRATAGSIFRVPVAVASLERALSWCHEGGARSWAAVVRGGVELAQADFTGPSVVVLGNEAEGLDEASIGLCQGAFHIEMAPSAESLNVGVTAALVAFRARRQR